MTPFFRSYRLEDKLGLDIKHDPSAGNYKVSYICFEKHYKAPMKFTENKMLEKRLETISKGIKKMLSQIKAPFEIIDAQIIYRPGIHCDGGNSTLAAKVSIRFEKEEHWCEFRAFFKSNFYRNGL